MGQGEETQNGKGIGIIELEGPKVSTCCHINTNLVPITVFQALSPPLSLMASF